MYSKRGEPSLHGWLDKQISGNVSATLQHFYFDQQSEKILQAFQKVELLKFFVDWSITDAKLFFEAPTRPGMMIDDTVRLVCLHTCYCWEKFLGNEFDQIQSWYGQVMSLKLD